MMTMTNADPVQLDPRARLPWPERVPLMRVPPEFSPFPTEVLGEPLSSLIGVLRESIQAPEAMIGSSVLAAIHLAVQAHVDVELDGRVMPTSEFFVTLGESGERKSAVDRVVLSPVRDLEEQRDADYRHDMQRHKLECELYEKRKGAELKDAEKISRDPQTILELIGPDPDAPRDPRILSEEPTFEGLFKSLERGQPAQGLFSDEGGHFIGGHGMNKDNRLKMATGLSNLWDGSALTRMRVDEAVTLFGRRMSLHLMLQPAVARLLFEDELLLEQGLLSRCLIAAPPSTAGSRPYRELNPMESPHFLAFREGIVALVSRAASVKPKTQSELERARLTLSPEAKSRWVAFHDQVEGQLGSDQPLSMIRALANKAPEHAVRVAGALSYFHDHGASEISLKWIAAAIGLVEFYLREAMRLTACHVPDPMLYRATVLLNWLRRRDVSTISLVEIYQRGPAQLRTAAPARAAMRVLVEHGEALPKDGGELFDGILRREAYWLRPANH